MRIGTKVKIINPGAVYSTYTTMYNRMGLEYPISRSGNMPKEGDICKVLANDTHLGTKVPLLGIETKNGLHFIIDEDAVEEVGKEEQSTISQLFEEKVKTLRNEG